jgi:hypothetical protein
MFANLLLSSFQFLSDNEIWVFVIWQFAYNWTVLIDFIRPLTKMCCTLFILRLYKPFSLISHLSYPYSLISHLSCPYSLISHLSCPYSLISHLSCPYWFISHLSCPFLDRITRVPPTDRLLKFVHIVR